MRCCCLQTEISRNGIRFIWKRLLGNDIAVLHAKDGCVIVSADALQAGPTLYNIAMVTPSKHNLVVGVE